VAEDLHYYSDKTSSFFFPNSVRLAFNSSSNDKPEYLQRTVFKIEEELRSFIYSILGRKFHIRVPKYAKVTSTGADIRALGNFILSLPVTLWGYFFKTSKHAHRFLVLYYWVENL
jgi:hypothetical protein